MDSAVDEAYVFFYCCKALSVYNINFRLHFLYTFIDRSV